MEFFILCAVLIVSLTPSHQIELGKHNDEVLRRLAALESAEKNSQYEIQQLRTAVENQKETIDKLRRELSKNQNVINPSEVGGRNQIRKDLLANKRLVLDSDAIPKVGFTAYLSAGVTLASEEIVPFNKSLANEGSGFNPGTGIFTCPPNGDGVYLFTFVISAAGASDSIGAMLVADGIDLVGALVETYQVGQDSQGGNQAVVRLKAGDQVWIRQSYGKYIASSETFRGSSFTGVFLYK